MNRVRDISRSEWHMIRQALREIDTADFTRIGLELRTDLLEWLDNANVGDYDGGRVTIVRND